jgi:toxin HigB-1
MIKSFATQGSADIFNRLPSREARRTCPESLWPVVRRKLDLINAAVSLNSLRMPPGNRLEALQHDRAGQGSIRINEKYRVCFVWTEQGAEQVEVVDYH